VIASLTRPRELSRLLDEPMLFFREHFATLAPIGVFTGVAAAIPSMLQQAWLGGMSQQELMKQMMSPGGLVTFMLVVYGGVFVAFFVFTFMRFAQMAAVVDLMDGRETDVFKAMRRALDWRLWVVAVLEPIFHSAAFCLACLPFFYTTVVLYPAVMVALHERRAVSAFGRCFQLFHHKAGQRGAWSNYLRIVVVLHVITFVMVAMTSVGGTVVFAYQALDGFTQFADGNFDPNQLSSGAPVWLSLPVGLFNGAVGGIGLMVTAAMNAWVYRDLRDTAEGVDLRLALAARRSAGA
jgi:hypothetical protein